jgi:predicted nucleic acid-binding Zn ribbon protein
MGAGSDYGMGTTNVDVKTGIRYGVISQHEVMQAWSDSSEADYGRPIEYECPECGESFECDNHQWGDSVTCGKCSSDFEIELPDDADPVGFYVDDAEYTATCGESGDIFVLKSPYFTRAKFCSPCAPGACYLTSPDEEGEKAYCFGHDWFDDHKAPYPVYSVETGALVDAPPK